MDEQLQLIALIAAAFLGPASAMSVGIRWLAKWSDERFQSAQEDRKELIEKIDKINGGQRANSERITRVEEVLKGLPCSDPSYRRRAYGMFRDIPE